MRQVDIMVHEQKQEWQAALEASRSLVDRKELEVK